MTFTPRKIAPPNGGKLPDYVGQTEDDRKRHRAARFAVVQCILINALKMTCWPKWARAMLEAARAEASLRKQCAPSRTLPASWEFWGIFWMLTFHLPRSAAELVKNIGKYLIRDLMVGIREMFNAVFGLNGQLIVSLYLYPHWHPDFHFHGICGAQPFEACHGLGGKDRSPIDLWANLPIAEKLKQLPDFYNVPPIELNADNLAELRERYRQLLVNVLGEKYMVDADMSKLLWVSKRSLASRGAAKKVANYMRNGRGMVLDDKGVYYYKHSDTVKVLFNAGPNKGCTKTCNVEDFVWEYIILPSMAFYGIRFTGMGTFAGQSKFKKKVLKFANNHPEVLPNWNIVKDAERVEEDFDPAVDMEPPMPKDADVMPMGEPEKFADIFGGSFRDM